MSLQDRWEALRRLDVRARSLAQTEFVRPVVIEAGAGTGKTATLVARVVTWALGPGWERALAELSAERAGREVSPEAVAARALGGVVAITFTEAAAGEMADRVGRTLVDVAAGAAPGWLLPEGLEPAGPAASERARYLLAGLDRLVVSTIHAYCHRLLAAYPFEAGLHPELKVDAEGERLESVVRDVMTEAVPRYLGPDPDPDWLDLAIAGHGPQELADCLQELAATGLPAEILAVDRFPAAIRRSLLSELVSAAGDLADLVGQPLADAKKVDVAQEVLEASRAALAWDPGLVAADLQAFDQACDAVREAWPKKLLTRLRDWSGGKVTPTETKVLGDAVRSLPELAMRMREAAERVAELRPVLQARVARVLHPLLAAVRQRLRAEGVLTFDDMLRGASALVRANPEVARRWRRGVRQLLVDEFQDTDHLQCELIAALALGGPVEERPGLFLVGDRKQSIYGWRNADLAAYNRFVERVITEAGGERGELAVSFRSVPALLDGVEKWISPHMAEEPELQAGFQPLAPCAANAGDDGFRQGRWAPLELWVSWCEEAGAGNRTRSRDATDLEAEALASDLVALHAEAGVPWNEVGVLVRSTGDLDRYLAAFRDASVPFVVERDRSYYKRREILDAAALVRAVVDPNDHVALIAWLRCPAVGVPDAAWLSLWRRGFPELVTGLRSPLPASLDALDSVVDAAVAAIPGDVPGLERIAGWPELLKLALRHLAELRASFASEPGVRFVDRLRTLTLIEATAAARYLGRFRVANLERFFRRLAASLDDGTSAPQEVLRVLRRAVREEREEKEARPTTCLDDAVRVLTIHRAKGLDFTHVYLLQTHKQAKRGVTRLNEALEGTGGWELRLLGAPTPGWRDLRRHRQKVAEMELVRTLYVAMTRAKRRLVVAGNWPVPGKGAPVGSHIELLASVGAVPEPGEDGTAETERGRFVWLARRRSPAPSREHAVRRSGTDLVARASADVARLLSCRQEARARMDRPFGQAVSAEAHRALEQVLAERQPEADEDDTRQPSRTLGGGVGALVGAAVHWVLETLPLEKPVAEALLGGQGALERWVRWHAPSDLADAVLREARSVLARFEASPLAERWATVSRCVVGREVPMLLPPSESGAVGFLSGQLDLLYRDPADHGLVVVDYKTDRVTTDRELLARAEVYSSQCRIYSRGVQEALGLAAAPRWELWFLYPGRVVIGGVDRKDLAVE